jgi:predicted secreted Zn-dependent protease
MRCLAALLTVALLICAGCGGSGSATSVTQEERVVEPPEESRVSVSVEKDYYPVYGNSAEELAASMTDSLKDAWAYCYWSVEWSLDARKVLAAYVPGTIAVTVDVAYTMPDWQPPDGTGPGLMGAWERFLSALWVHEQGHEANGTRAGEAVLEALEQLPPRLSRQELEDAAAFAAGEVLQDYWDRDAEYDTATGHGVTQDAVLQYP